MQTKELIKSSKELRLLYVEDELISRAVTLELLENFFTDITVAVNGEDALEKFQNNVFDIIISDINMPRINGMEMLERIRQSNVNIPVVFLSAHYESRYLSEGIRLGVTGYLVKPLIIDNFIILLSKICEKIILEKENKKYQSALESEVQKHTRELAVKLHYDELTGLHNRYSFFQDVKKSESDIVFIVDINKFKVINEIYGTEIGSLVLQKFAAFLIKFTKNTTYKVYRLSGDEFVVQDTQGQIDTDKYEKDLASFLNAMQSFSIDIGGDSISIEVTIGICSTGEDTFECAKTALDYAKRHKRPYQMYSSAIDKRIEEQDALSWKDKTKHAIADNRIVPVYHAIVDSNAKVTKYEALMRLKDEKTHELITPYYFLDVAIKTGLYASLSSHIIFESLHLLEKTSNVLSFNFTYEDVQNESLLNEIEVFFKTYANTGSRAVFEITESESLEDYSEVKKFIQRFRVYGVAFAIDDFGSGFSNFGHILELEPEYLKIDGSLIKNIDTDEKSYILVSAIVEFSHKLGIKVIAEYVHSKEIFDMLKVLKVDEYQGFYFAEPTQHI